MSANPNVVFPPSFHDMGLDARLIDAIEQLGFEAPTPIQARSMGPLLEGRDVIGRARTGSGKTAAFGLPLLERLKGTGNGTAALVVVPTRELAIQVAKAIRSYAVNTPVEVATIYGGSDYRPQIRALRAGVPVVVGTPGRLIDHLEKGALDLSQLRLMVLDEADEMLRMGFIDDVETLLAATPEGKQVALFSATMPDQIRRIADSHLNNPLEIEVEGEDLTTTHIEQRWMQVPQQFKAEALIRLLESEERQATLVFARTRANAGELADVLAQRGFAADALHGDLNQPARERVLQGLRTERIDVVVATDVASRGIDVPHITHVINVDLPDDAETYVHRIGRTGRAGRDGVAINLVSPRERGKRAAIERALGTRFETSAVPSDADIARRKQRSLSDAMKAAPEGEGIDRLLADLREANAWSDADVAKAALGLLASERSLALEKAPDNEPPYWGRPRGGGRRDRAQAPTDEDSLTLFLSVGGEQGVQIRDVVGALANGAGVPAGAIGKVQVHARKTFVQVARPVAKRLLDSIDELELRGTPARLTVAHPSAVRAEPPQRARARRGPPNGRPAFKGKKKFFGKKRK